jgi:hypothetical protein
MNTQLRIQHMEVSLSMQISTVSDEQLLVFTEYRFHVGNVALARYNETSSHLSPRTGYHAMASDLL